MFWFQKKKAVAIIKRDTLSLFVDGQLFHFGFPELIVANSSIVLQDRFKSLIKAYFEAKNIKNCSIELILSDDLIYHKALNNDEKIFEQTQAFLDQIPFDPKQLLNFQTEIEGQKLLFVVNRDYLKKLIQALKQQQCQVSHIFPEIMFGLVTRPNWEDKNFLLSVLENSNLSESTDILKHLK